MDRRLKIGLAVGLIVFLAGTATGYSYWRQQEEEEIVDCCALPPVELPEEEASVFIGETQENFQSLDSFELEITQELSIESAEAEDDENEATSIMDVVVQVSRPDTIYVQHAGDIDGYTRAQELYYNGEEGFIRQEDDWEETMGITSHDLSHMNQFYNLFTLIEDFEEHAVVMVEDRTERHSIEITAFDEEADEWANTMNNLATEVISVVFEEKNGELLFDNVAYRLYVDEETHLPYRLRFNLRGTIVDEEGEEFIFRQRVITDFLHLNEVEITESPQ